MKQTRNFAEFWSSLFAEAQVTYLTFILLTLQTFTLCELCKMEIPEIPEMKNYYMALWRLSRESGFLENGVIFSKSTAKQILRPNIVSTKIL
jgi:hypothetical protein